MIADALKAQVKALGLQKFVDQFGVRRDIGDYNLDEFIDRLPNTLFPSDLVSRFVQWCKAKSDFEEYLPVALLYQFLQFNLAFSHGYPSDAPL